MAHARNYKGTWQTSGFPMLRPFGVWPVYVVKLSTRLVDPFISVRAKEIPLPLQEILGQNGGAVGVKVGQSTGESGQGNGMPQTHGDHVAPRGLKAEDFFLKPRDPA